MSLSNLFGKVRDQASAAIFGRPTPSTDNVEFTEDPCLTCSAPCAEGHAAYPDAIVKSIETKDALLGTMKPYKRHAMYCAGTGDAWPGSLEDDLAADAFQSAIRAGAEAGTKAAEGAGRNPGRTIISAIDAVPEGHSEGSESVTDVKQTEVLLFPDYKALRGVTAAEASSIVNEWVANGALPASVPAPVAELVDLTHEAYVFVCVHKKRDKRCGVTGPMLIKEFNHALEDAGLSDKVAVAGISHIGGHKYAGNIYSKKFPQGVWYGRVITCHVEHIIKSTVLEGKIFKELFRGQGTA
ncbi:Sucrase/ferredoxin-like-domain-containing protein [Chytriomyces sp. MP71]|nr:Sucrase/ferredoxin-like-domain-containing protein [Chytriomyces sp. MP71]